MFPIAVCVPHTYTNKCNRYNIHVLYVYTAQTFSYVHKKICRKRLQISKKIGRNLQFSRIFFYLAVYFWRSSCRKVSVFYRIFLLPFIFEIYRTIAGIFFYSVKSHGSNGVLNHPLEICLRSDMLHQRCYYGHILCLFAGILMHTPAA